MKKVLICILSLFLSVNLFSQENVQSEENNTDSKNKISITKNNVKVTIEELIEEKKNGYNPTVNLTFYLPSLLGEVCGSSPYMGIRQNVSEVLNVASFNIESKVDIKTFGRFGFSWNFALSPYFETQLADGFDNKYSGLGLSLGAGVYLHPFSKDVPCISGLTFNFYPMYKQYIVFNGVNYLNWKLAWDCGYTFSLGQLFSVYPYFRRVYGFGPDTFIKSFDFGIAIGIYFHRL